MAEQQFNESVYKFTDPVRLFKSNDPYYFEVDNIPLKQLQENILWLKDQIRREVISISGVKRFDIDELRPYSSGEDRVVRVKPGRYTARVNDASTKRPLAYLNQVLGLGVGEFDTYEAALPNPGTMSTPTESAVNALLEDALTSFKTNVAERSLGMNGLGERSFTWPMVQPDRPVNSTGVVVSTQFDSGALGYESPGTGRASELVPMIITEAYVWAKSVNSAADRFLLTTYDFSDPVNGFALMPKTESFFVRAWRGIARTAIVDLPEEISIEVPSFDQSDFNYIDETGVEVPVPGVVSRVDMVFIYSKPVDVSSTTILKGSGKETITSPTLGIVRGAGIKANFQETSDYQQDYIQSTGDDHKILASPGDAQNENIGFRSGEGDVAFDVRGSFPSPDDLLNIAPLLSNQLENEAFELVGQSILPVAYIWVTAGSTVVAPTDVIDIRPLFRTAELSYNERAGIAAALPQLSLANPAVGKAQLDYELREQYNEVNGRIIALENGGINGGLRGGIQTVAAGYVFGGYNFGPEGALYDHYSKVFAADSNPNNDTEQAIKARITEKYGFDTVGFDIPAYPDWDLAEWALLNSNVTEAGRYPNDYINVFHNEQGIYLELPNEGIFGGFEGRADAGIVAGSYREYVAPNGTTGQPGRPTPNRCVMFSNTTSPGPLPDRLNTPRVNFSYIKKKINFDRGQYPNMVDYSVDVEFMNCIPQISGAKGVPSFAAAENNPDEAARYIGNWVEKGKDYFIIYVAFTTHDTLMSTYPLTGQSFTSALVPAPHTYQLPGRNRVTVSERGGERFSGFLALTDDILTANTNPFAQNRPDPLLGEQENAYEGYIGNPRVGKCTYPTITWKLNAISSDGQPYFYGNLNSTDPVIQLNQN